MSTSEPTPPPYPVITTTPMDGDYIAPPPLPTTGTSTSGAAVVAPPAMPATHCGGLPIAFLIAALIGATCAAVAGSLLTVALRRRRP